MTQPLDYRPAPAIHDPAGEVPAEYDVFCEGCGYSLAGIVTDRCPECGKPYDASEMPFARIPWLHRRRIGRVRAYLATVRMVILRPRRFAHELCRPVRISIQDARRFRRVTLRIAVWSIALTIIAMIVIAAGRTIPSTPVNGLAMTGLVLVAVTVAAAVFLAMVTDMPLFIWKGLPALPPTALAPIHHYASAPLALMPVLGVVAVSIFYMLRLLPGPRGWWAPLIWAAFPIALVLEMWILPVVLMRTATGCGAKRTLALSLYLPLHWLIMGVMVGACLVLLLLTAEEFRLFLP